MKRIGLVVLLLALVFTHAGVGLSAPGRPAATAPEMAAAAAANPGDRDAYFLAPRYATDSASAGTALSTGYKTDDGNIAWLPGDPVTGSLTTIVELLRADHGSPSAR